MLPQFCAEAIDHIMKTRRHSQSIMNTQKGAALTIAILFFLIISIAVAMGAVGPLVRELHGAQGLIKSKSAYFLAEAGSEDAIYRIKKGKQLSNPEVFSLNGGSVSVAVSAVSSSEKEIIASGSIAANDRNVKLTISAGVGSDFSYGAQVGDGGLVMAQNSKIKGTGGAVGNVFSNGPITGANGATVTGDATVATSVVEDVQAQSTVCNQNQVIATTTPQVDFAQSFLPGDSKPLYKISLYIKKTGSPGSTTMRIVADSSGIPNTTTLASASLQSGLVTGAYGWVDVVFSSPVNVVNSNTYWIVLDDDGANTTNYWTWCKDSNNGFGNGVAKYRASWDSGSAWSSAITGDLTFKTYLGGGPGMVDQVSVNGNAKANTITNSTIGGTAYCQTGSGNNQSCNTSQADPSPLTMPLSDANIDQWKTDATAGGTISGDYTVSSNVSLGPKKITGNLIMTSNNKTLTVTGVLYVQGNVDVSNGSIIKCDVSFGADSCVLVVDGWINAGNGSNFQGSGQVGSYILGISTIGGCNGGSQMPSCGPGNSGISISNNLVGAVFYTTKSMIDMANNAQLKAVVGYKLNLANGTEIEYEQGVVDASFSSGPGGGWNVKNWKEVE